MKNLTKALLAASIIIAPVFGDSIIQVPNTAVNQRILRQLDLDYDCMGNNEHKLHFLMDEHAEKVLSDRKFFKTELFSQSITAVQDVDAVFAEITAKEDLGIYHTFEEMEDELRTTVETYPNLSNLRVGAQSHEGRPIYVLELTAKDSTRDKVNFLVTGTHHAREWISTEVPMAFIKHLTEGYGQDALITELLDTSVIVVVPMVNPDGGVYSRTKKTMWRKNRRKPEGKWMTGVDNNRNYPYHFGGAGASGWSGSQTYHGPKSLSEVENQLIVQLAQEYGFKTAVSFHSYSELVLWPWGYTTRVQTKDNEIFVKYGTKMGEIMGYRPMQASQLYAAAGIFDDTMYADYGVLAYTIELGKQFIPKEEDVPEILDKSIKALRYLFTNARNPFGNVEETPVRQVKRILERLVYHMEDPNNTTEIARDHLKLDNFKGEVLSQAMTELNMHPALREKITAGIERFRLHHNLYSE